MNIQGTHISVTRKAYPARFSETDFRGSEFWPEKETEFVTIMIFLSA